jgi:aminoglycoside phosphotransferase family enzyme/predicted kinase
MMNENKPFLELEQSASTGFATMLSMLTHPEAFPFEIPSNTSIVVIQTHASAVLLTSQLVYKVKKPKNFGFFDYSTPSLRRHFCGEEVRVNRRYAPQVYLGVAPILVSPGGQFRFGPPFAPDEVPTPGTKLEGRDVVDYAVVMLRLPDEAMLESQVHTNTADSLLLQEIAQHVAAFHAASPTDEHIASFGGPEVIRGNWEENFQQLRPYIGRTLDAATYDLIADYISGFMRQRRSLFTSRVSEGRIRDCHGDLRLQHVYYLKGVEIDSARQLPGLALLDGIEFNERFRYSDVASEVAFLTMELEAASRCDLARAFVQAYIVASRDQELRELLPFYSCYRACIRGKVLSFQMDEPEVPLVQREIARREAISLFQLATRYSSGATKPTLMLIGGLMGTGKSTLAVALQNELGWELFSTDSLRKYLAHVDPTKPYANAFGQGLYSQQWTARTYEALLEEAKVTLTHGRSVLLDASFIRRADRQAATQLGSAFGAHVLFVECICPEEVALERLAQRWKIHTGESTGALEEASRASDARPDLYEAQSCALETYHRGDEPDMEWITVKTTRPLAVSCEQVYSRVHIPRFACWL